ncbi:MAG: TonB-dependent receptor plug domain-containing protein [Aquabacterium sp.]|nr:TonB-dependent receptor plug domain-containing protein [Aquabacterium sp.]
MSSFVSGSRVAAKRPISIAVISLMALVSCAAHAQSSSDEEELSLVFGDKDTVSIATGSQQPLRRAPAVATVITAEDIAAMGATDLDEVLETVPGIHVARSIQAYSPLYVVRGIYSDYNPQTLMLQNGVPMTTLFVGNRGNAWFGLPLENIARIEVIRGPGSALYGADAYSGVINIISQAPSSVYAPGPSTPGTPGRSMVASWGHWTSRAICEWGIRTASRALFRLIPRRPLTPRCKVSLACPLSAWLPGRSTMHTMPWTAASI